MLVYLRDWSAQIIFTCCHTETKVADPTFYLTQSQYTDTGPTSPSADLIMPGAWQGSHWSANFLSHWYDSTPEKFRRKSSFFSSSSFFLLTVDPLSRILTITHLATHQSFALIAPRSLDFTSQPFYSLYQCMESMHREKVCTAQAAFVEHISMCHDNDIKL